MDRATSGTKVSARAADLPRRDEAVEAKVEPCTNCRKHGDKNHPAYPHRPFLVRSRCGRPWRVLSVSWCLLFLRCLDGADGDRSHGISRSVAFAVLRFLAGAQQR